MDTGYLFLSLALGLATVLVIYVIGTFVGSRRGSAFSIRRPEQWAIGILTGSSPLTLVQAGASPNPVLTADDVTDMEADFVADPFMIYADDQWYMFFEVVRTETRMGEIAYATSRDGVSWAYQQMVLREPFHLSYPHVFTWNERFYMIPESRAINAVRLYEAVEFPTQWVPKATLLHGVFDDPSIFRHEGRWWMLVATWHDTLRLFFADALEGPWEEHPMSPLVQNNMRTARPAGRVIAYDGRLYRFSQDCETDYGMRVFAFEITTLTLTAYEECEVSAGPVLAGSGRGWNSERMHHLDAHRLPDGSWLASVDGYAGRRLVVGR